MVVAVAVVAVTAVAAGAVVAVRRARDGAAASAGGGLILRVSVEQYRTDEVARTVEVAFRNDGPVPVRVSRIDLRLPSFEGAKPVAVDALLPPGGLRVDVPVPFGTGRCEGVPAGPTTAASTVVADATPEGGRLRTVRLALEHPNPLLDKLLRLDCEQARLRRAASVHFGAWRPDRGGLRGSVVVDRGVEDMAVTIEDLTGSIMYAIAAPGARPLGTLAPGQRRLRIPVTATPGRCDQHALAEIKKPFVFPAWATLGAGEKLYTEITVSDADKKQLDAMLRRVCHLPPAGS